MSLSYLEYAGGGLITETVRCLHDRARIEDRYFDEKKYTWRIGIDIWESLCVHTRYSIPIIVHQDVETKNYLMGIPVELDYDFVHRLQLFKEVKLG